MAITYTWKVKGMRTVDVNSVTDFVVQTYWEKTGTNEEGISGTFQGATPFDTDTMDPASMVSFDQLTEEIVLGWIQAVVVGSYEEHVNKVIDENIQRQKVKDVNLPWAPNDPTPMTAPAMSNVKP